MEVITRRRLLAFGIVEQCKILQILNMRSECLPKKEDVLCRKVFKKVTSQTWLYEKF